MIPHIYAKVEDVKVIAHRGEYVVCRVALDDEPKTVFFTPPRGKKEMSLPRIGDKVLIDLEHLLTLVRIFRHFSNEFQGSFIYFGDFSRVISDLKEMAVSLPEIWIHPNFQAD